MPMYTIFGRRILLIISKYYLQIGIFIWGLHKFSILCITNGRTQWNNEYQNIAIFLDPLKPNLCGFICMYVCLLRI